MVEKYLVAKDTPPESGGETSKYGWLTKNDHE
jgi:hypothetical protein